MAENMIQGEANTLTITVKDTAGSAIDVSTSTITMWGKRQLDASTDYLFQKANSDFEKNVGGSSNVVAVILLEGDMNWSGVAHIIVEFRISETNIKKGIFEIKNVASPE